MLPNSQESIEYAKPKIFPNDFFPVRNSQNLKLKIFFQRVTTIQIIRLPRASTTQWFTIILKVKRNVVWAHKSSKYLLEEKIFVSE
jgi:hypothetical protein